MRRLRAYRNRSPVPARAAFTLAEVMVSVMVGGILMAGVASALVISSRAVDPAGPTTAVTAAADVVEQMAADLYCAQSFNTRLPNDVEFLVADRNNDSSPELIRFVWSGTPGDPLLRFYNGVSYTAARGVQDFGVGIFSRTVTKQEMTASSSNTGSVMFATFTSWTGITPVFVDMPMSTTNWISEYFQLQTTIPSTAFNVKITRVEMKIKRGSAATPILSVSIVRPKIAGGPLPGTSVLDVATVPTANISTSYTWVGADFANANVNYPENEFCILVKTTTSTASIQELTSNSAPTDVPILMWTSDSGGTWNPSSNRNRQDIAFNVYGSYDTRTAAQANVTRYFIDSARIVLRLNSNPTTAVRTTVPVANGPEVLTP